MQFLYILTIFMVIISFLINPSKTQKGILVGLKKLWKITPSFFSVLASIAIVLSLVPNNVIVNYLGGRNSYLEILIALIIGSVTVMPGPIVYPLCAIMIGQGVSYSVVAAFSASLMLVGVVTFPVEKFYFGIKFALLRNIFSLGIAFLISLIFLIVSGKVFS